MIQSQNAVERALRQLMKRLGLDDSMMVTARTTLGVIANDALELMAKRVAEGDAYEGLQKDFAVTPTTGFIDLTALTGILFDINRCRIRVTASNATVRACDSYETLEHGDLPLDQVWYAQDGRGLRFRGTDGSISTFVSPVLIRANYIPSFTDVTLPIPDQFKAALVTTMVELAIGQMTESRELAQTGGA